LAQSITPLGNVTHFKDGRAQSRPPRRVTCPSTCSIRSNSVWKSSFLFLYAPFRGSRPQSCQSWDQILSLHVRGASRRCAALREWLSWASSFSSRERDCFSICFNFSRNILTLFQEICYIFAEEFPLLGSKDATTVRQIAKPFKRLPRYRLALF